MQLVSFEATQQCPTVERAIREQWERVSRPINKLPVDARNILAPATDNECISRCKHTPLYALSAFVRAPLCAQY